MAACCPFPAALTADAHAGGGAAPESNRLPSQGFLRGVGTWVGSDLGRAGGPRPHPPLCKAPPRSEEPARSPSCSLIVPTQSEAWSRRQGSGQGAKAESAITPFRVQGWGSAGGRRQVLGWGSCAGRELRGFCWVTCTCVLMFICAIQI